MFTSFESPSSGVIPIQPNVSNVETNTFNYDLQQNNSSKNIFSSNSKITDIYPKGFSMPNDTTYMNSTQTSIDGKPTSFLRILNRLIKENL